MASKRRAQKNNTGRRHKKKAVIKAQEKKTSSIRRIWDFLWNDDSLLSWIVNIIVIAVFIKFIFYPGIGFLLGTKFPIVAVMSGSMEHKAVSVNSIAGTSKFYDICGQRLTQKGRGFDFFWDNCGEWYEQLNITKEKFTSFSLSNGFNTGDIIILKGPNDIHVGDIIVFFTNSRGQPIIHRVVEIYNDKGKTYYHTKGDHNIASLPFEEKVGEEYVVGKAFFKIPYLGWLKKIVVDSWSKIKPVFQGGK